ncbi:MAG: hypothetical protein JWQ20_4556 [Conexibacter sp.]|nr:hypothetical protein [Conexibacter sp.]
MATGAVDAPAPAIFCAMRPWAGVLNHVGILAVLALLFLLAFRLRGENLFTAG